MRPKLRRCSVLSVALVSAVLSTAHASQRDWPIVALTGRGELVRFGSFIQVTARWRDILGVTCERLPERDGNTPVRCTRLGSPPTYTYVLRPDVDETTLGLSELTQDGTLLTIPARDALFRKLRQTPSDTFQAGNYRSWPNLMTFAALPTGDAVPLGGFRVLLNMLERLSGAPCHTTAVPDNEYRFQLTCPGSAGMPSYRFTLHHEPAEKGVPRRFTLDEPVENDRVLPSAELFRLFTHLWLEGATDRTAFQQ